MSPRARAMSLLEVVFAVVLLALVASAVTSAVSFVGGSEVRAQKRLGAYELANRLILQYLTDQREMPPAMRPLDYDRFQYRYELAETRLLLQSAAGGTPVPGADRRFKEVRISVWESDGEVTGSPAGEPLAVLTRLIDPFARRNPEAVKNLRGEDLIREIEVLIGVDTLPQGGGR